MDLTWLAQVEVAMAALTGVLPEVFAEVQVGVVATVARAAGLVVAAAAGLYMLTLPLRVAMAW